MAVKSAETVEWALRRAGVKNLKELHVLEVGAGECDVHLHGTHHSSRSQVVMPETDTSETLFVSVSR